MRDNVTKIDNTAPADSGILSAAEDNVRFNELKNAVTTSGIALDPAGGTDTDQKMLAQAIARYASGAIFCQDTGVANSYVLQLTGTFQAPKVYFTGMEVDFYPGSSSTDASQINAFGLGFKKFLRPDGSPMQANDVFSNKRTTARYDATLDGGAGAFKMAPWAIQASATGSTVPISGEGVSVDNTFHVSLNYPGLTHRTTIAPVDLLSFFSNSEAHHRAITFADFIALLGSSTGGLINIQVLTASGTYTKTVGTSRALVFATAGGGGGGSGGNTAGGGGAGGTAVAFVDLSSISTVACVVGAGGAQGNGGFGGNGGDTNYGTYAVAQGGQGGGPKGTFGGGETYGAGGPGGSTSVGLLRLGGQSGGAGGPNDGGLGGSSFWGGGGRPGDHNHFGAIGGDGSAPGAGGGGNDGNNVQLGGRGAAGMIFVIEFG